MTLAMVAEDHQINVVLEDLFAEEGSDLQIRQAGLYLREGEELRFCEIILRARRTREIVIGYRSATAERAVINPPAKSEKQKWSLKNVFVVIAEKRMNDNLYCIPTDEDIRLWSTCQDIISLSIDIELPKKILRDVNITCK